MINRIPRVQDPYQVLLDMSCVSATGANATDESKSDNAVKRVRARSAPKRWISTHLKHSTVPSDGKKRLVEAALGSAICSAPRNKRTSRQTLLTFWEGLEKTKKSWRTSRTASVRMPLSLATDLRRQAARNVRRKCQNNLPRRRHEGKTGTACSRTCACRMEHVKTMRNCGTEMETR